MKNRKKQENIKNRKMGKWENGKKEKRGKK